LSKIEDAKGRIDIKVKDEAKKNSVLEWKEVKKVEEKTKE
jgi:hypothetical protein